MPFTTFESAIKEAAEKKVIAGGAVATVYKTDEGYKHYIKGFGKESLEPNSRDMSENSLMWIASCTKLVTAISVLQLVERGIITLDEPLSTILPEYTPPIPIVSLEPPTTPDGEPTLVTTTTDKPLTLRILLTHTSGLKYEAGSPALQAWRASLPRSDPRSGMRPWSGNVVVGDHLPLLFEPGALGRWEYGPSIDWAGKVLERVNGEGLSLGAYMKKYVFAPLGMETTTFRPISEGLGDRLFPRTSRLEDGSTGVDPMNLWPHAEPEDEFGGGGLYSTVSDYVKVLESLVKNDGKLLKSTSVDELFKPQLPESEELQKRLALNNEAMALAYGTEWEGKDQIRWNFSLCGLSVLNDVPGKCEVGTGLWSGLPNLFWWVDRKRGTAGIYGSQMFRSADEQTMRLSENLRKCVFEAAST